jgi:chaperone LolA
MARFFIWCVLAGLAVGSSAETRELVSRFEARYNAARTLQASFIELYSENGQTLRTEAGSAFFRRKGKMRWEYEVPEKNLFLVDGKTAWFYVPADRTVTRVPATKSEDWRTPLALLAGETKLSRICRSLEPARHEQPLGPGDAVLSCTLREQSAGTKEAASDQPEALQAVNDGT